MFFPGGLFIYFSVKFVLKFGGFFSKPEVGLGGLFAGFKRQAALTSGQHRELAVE